MKPLIGFGVGLTCAVLVARASLGAREPVPLIVHEWGTVTTRHAADGTPQGNLNHIDAREVLPAFVHRFEPPQTQAAGPAAESRLPLAKSPVTPGRPDVTMRLETPVIYFHPPAGAEAPPRVDAEVTFAAGSSTSSIRSATRPSRWASSGSTPSCRRARSSNGTARCSISTSSAPFAGVASR